MQAANPVIPPEGGNRQAAAKLLGLTGATLRKAIRDRLSAFADEGWDEGIRGGSAAMCRFDNKNIDRYPGLAMII